MLLFQGCRLNNKASLLSNRLKNNDSLMLFELYLDEDVEIDANIIVTNNNHPKFNLNNFWIIETLFIERNRQKYKRKFPKQLFK